MKRKRVTGKWKRRETRICRICSKYKTAAKHGLCRECFGGVYFGVWDLQGEERCKICGAVPRRRRLNLDYDPKTDSIRGLLCYSCNGGLRLFKDDPDRRQAAVDHLIEPLDYKIEQIEYEETAHD